MCGYSWTTAPKTGVCLTQCLVRCRFCATRCLTSTPHSTPSSTPLWATASDGPSASPSRAAACGTVWGRAPPTLSLARPLQQRHAWAAQREISETAAVTSSRLFRHFPLSTSRNVSLFKCCAIHLGLSNLFLIIYFVFLLGPHYT
jgi:hypothetical protein